MKKFNVDLSKVDWKQVIAVTVTIGMSVATGLANLKEKQEAENREKVIKELQASVKALESKSKDS